MEINTKILTALGIVAVLVIGGIVIAETVKKNEPVPEDVVKITGLDSDHYWSHYVIHYYCDTHGTKCIYFYADGVEIASVGAYDKKGDFDCIVNEPPVIPTMQNLTYIIR